MNWTRFDVCLMRNIRESVHSACYSRACAPSERKLARDRQMIARLTWKIGNCAARRSRLHSTAANEVEPKWKKTASRENKLAHETRCVCPIFQRRQVHSAGGMDIIEASPGEARRRQILEERFISPGRQNPGGHIGKRKNSHRTATVVRGPAAERVRIE